MLILEFKSNVIGLEYKIKNWDFQIKNYTVFIALKNLFIKIFSAIM